MNFALSVLRLMCLAWLVPVVLLKGSNTQNQRRHKDVYLGENTRHKHGGRIDFKTKKSDSTKSLLIKSEQLLRIEDHDFAMRPGFGGSAIPVGIDVQVESIDSISEVNMDFTMTLYLRHYWQDDRLAFPSSNNKSRTFDARLVKKIWVPDVFFVHSKRSFIHDTTMENIMLRVYPDGNILYSVRITVTALCSMGFSRFPLDTQNCSLELESCEYDRLRFNIVLSLIIVFISVVNVPYSLFLSGWYNRLYINFILRRHIFFFMLQTYFPTMLMVMLSWVSFWIDRRAVPARVSLGITTVLTMSTIITGVSASMPQVSYVKAVDIYLWASFLFVFLSVIEYAAVNYFTTVEEMKKLQKGKLPVSYDATQAMAYDGCFHDDIDVSPFPELPTTPSTTRTIPPRASSTEPPPTEGTRLWRKRSVGKNIRFIMSNSYMIDSYSRIIFPLAYLLFNIIYWCIYS
uniref:Gamma-aminobutyric acid receptor subunit rho-1-like n=1 Tax=Sinocyclocheilus rhinocerous TaxID=307959 RepID=A0A673FQX5_9TELE